MLAVTDDDAHETGPDLPEHAQLSYDCAAWATETRSMLTSLLHSNDIGHVWQGTTLTVHERDEQSVDDLVDEVLDAASSPLDPDAPKLVYEVGTWPAALQTELADALAVDDIAYEWDHNGDLVVAESDEQRVVAVLEELPDPDEHGISSDDGVALHELLDRIFVAADRLVRNGSDAQGTVALVEGADLVGRVALPFGFEPAVWRSLVAQITELARSLGPSSSGDETSEPEPEPETIAISDEQVSELARALREHLRDYV